MVQQLLSRRVRGKPGRFRSGDGHVFKLIVVRDVGARATLVLDRRLTAEGVQGGRVQDEIAVVSGRVPKWLKGHRRRLQLLTL